jgi:hypothetical protein
MKERAQELKAEARRGRRADKGTGKAPCSRRSPRCRNRIAPWPSGSSDRQGHRASPLAQNLVRDVRVRQGRQGRLLLRGCVEVQIRYATFGFNDEANLDEGAIWPTTFALKELTGTEEARIGALVKKAVS